MAKKTKRLAAFLWLSAAIGVSAVSVIAKPARIKSSDKGKADRYIYSIGGKKKKSSPIIAVTNVSLGKAAKTAAKNFLKNI